MVVDRKSGAGFTSGASILPLLNLMIFLLYIPDKLSTRLLNQLKSTKELFLIQGGAAKYYEF